MEYCAMITIFVISAQILHCRAETKCELSEVPTNRMVLPWRAPLLVMKTKSDKYLALPTAKDRDVNVSAEDGAKLFLSCPVLPYHDNNSVKNMIGTKPSRNSPADSCSKMSDDDNIHQTSGVYARHLHLKRVECQEKVIPVVRKTTIKCADESDGEIHEVGFDVGAWYPIFSTCYNSKKSKVLYSEHTLYGESVEARIKLLKELNTFSVRELEHTDVSRVVRGHFEDYFLKWQNTQIETIVGAENLRKYFDGKTRRLVKALLTPEGDMPYPTWDIATQIKENFVAAWIEVYKRNWRLVEENVRKFASYNMLELIVRTGVHGHLELSDKKGIPRKLSLWPNTDWQPVPAYLWKVVYHADTNAGVAFLVSNNPYTSICNDWAVCSSGCAKYGWNETSFDDAEKGCTYCCSVTDIIPLISNIPPMEAEHILLGPDALHAFDND